MKARMDFRAASPEGAKAIGQLHAFIHRCGLERGLLELVKLRASQINGCAHCIDMHTKELRADGESEQRLYLLDAWQELPFYSDRERAALAWTEAVTLVTDGHVPDDVYELARSSSASRSWRISHSLSSPSTAPTASTSRSAPFPAATALRPVGPPNSASAFLTQRKPCSVTLRCPSAARASKGDGLAVATPLPCILRGSPHSARRRA